MTTEQIRNVFTEQFKRIEKEIEECKAITNQFEKGFPENDETSLKISLNSRIQNAIETIQKIEKEQEELKNDVAKKAKEITEEDLAKITILEKKTIKYTEVVNLTKKLVTICNILKDFKENINNFPETRNEFTETTIETYTNSRNVLFSQISSIPDEILIKISLSDTFSELEHNLVLVIVSIFHLLFEFDAHPAEDTLCKMTSSPFLIINSHKITKESEKVPNKPSFTFIENNSPFWSMVEDIDKKSQMNGKLTTSVSRKLVDGCADVFAVIFEFFNSQSIKSILSLACSIPDTPSASSMSSGPTKQAADQQKTISFLSIEEQIKNEGKDNIVVIKKFKKPVNTSTKSSLIYEFGSIFQFLAGLLRLLNHRFLCHKLIKTWFIQKNEKNFRDFFQKLIYSYLLVSEHQTFTQLSIWIFEFHSKILYPLFGDTCPTDNFFVFPIPWQQNKFAFERELRIWYIQQFCDRQYKSFRKTLKTLHSTYADELNFDIESISLLLFSTFEITIKNTIPAIMAQNNDGSAQSSKSSNPDEESEETKQLLELIELVFKNFVSVFRLFWILLVSWSSQQQQQQTQQQNLSSENAAHSLMASKFQGLKTFLTFQKNLKEMEQKCLFSLIVDTNHPSSNASNEKTSENDLNPSESSSKALKKQEIVTKLFARIRDVVENYATDYLNTFLLVEHEEKVVFKSLNLSI